MSVFEKLSVSSVTIGASACVRTVAALLVLSSALNAHAQPINLSGTWVGEYRYVNQCLNYVGEETLRLTDVDGFITGTVTDVTKSPVAGLTASGDVFGTFDGTQLVLEYSASYHVPPVRLTATVTGPNSIQNGRVVGVCGSGAEVSYTRTQVGGPQTLILAAVDPPPPLPQSSFFPSNYHWVPQMFGGSNKGISRGKERVAIQAFLVDSSFQPVAGKDVDFQVPELLSLGDHFHNAAGQFLPSPPLPGTLDYFDIFPVPFLPYEPGMTCRTDATGFCTVFFVNPATSGSYRIKAKMKGGSPEAQVDVAIRESLQCLASAPNGEFRLTGRTDTHPANHCGSSYLVYILPVIAAQYQSAVPLAGSLGINDMSLPDGGLFDLSGFFHDLVDGHKMHRTGYSVDIDHSTGPNLVVYEPLLNLLFEAADFYRIPEGAISIHYEKNP